MFPCYSKDQVKFLVSTFQGPVYKPPNLGPIGPISDPVGPAEVYPPLLMKFFIKKRPNFGRVPGIRFLSYRYPILIR